MPHRKNRSSKAPRPDAIGEPRAYAAHDLAGSSLAPPAAGEVEEYLDDSVALGMSGQQQGATNTNRPVRSAAGRRQGRLTRAANRDIVRGKQPGDI
ncbi:MAG TPA: hypothetical protein VHY34_10060 [Caulobacteraceae bacterium]|jgi:hypothetical protein|nr:hypothetical protein [Caulobacteraceae bacterium]